MEKNDGLIKISERLYFLPFEENADRPNLYYVLGDDYSIAIDAGNSKAHVMKFYEALKKNDLPLPRYTILSHWHWDHTFGLKYINGQSMSSRLTHDKLLEVGKWEWTIEEMKKREDSGEDIAFCNDCILIEYKDLNEIEVETSDIVIDSDTKLDLGGISLTLMPRTSTHSDDSLFVHIPDEEALIVADADCEDFYNGAVYDKKKLEDMIAFFDGIDYRWHYLGHAFRESKQEAIDRLKNELINCLY